MEETLLNTAAEVQPETESVGEETAAEQVDVDTQSEDVAATTPPSETAEDTTETESPEEERFITVKYDKKLRSLSLDEATMFAQKGMRYDALQPMLETLKYVATSEGKTLAEFVEAIRSQHEDNLFSRLMDRCGDEDIAKELLEVEKSKHKAAYEKLLESERTEESETEEAVTKRLADEFDELKREFPQYTSFDKVPKSIVKEAVERGVSLLDSQLRYEHRQRAKAEAAAAAQSAAAKNSIGSQQTAVENPQSTAEAAFLKGLWG